MTLCHRMVFIIFVICITCASPFVDLIFIIFHYNMQKLQCLKAGHAMISRNSDTLHIQLDNISLFLKTHLRIKRDNNNNNNNNNN